jgi:SAM-dependent methyltransferase
MHLYIGIYVIALATLAVEISLVRVLSVITWYHLAFFAISTAMLGMTAGAVTVFLKGEWFAGERLERSSSLACIGFAVVVPLMLVQLNLMPLGFEQAGFNVMSVSAFLIATLMCALPFYFSGIAIAAVLTLAPVSIGRIYAADLVGAATGCLLVLVGLSVADGPSFILFCGGLGGLAAMAFAWRVPAGNRKLAGMTFVVVGGLAVINALSAGGIRPYMVKESVVDPERVQLERWNSYSHILVDKPVMSPPQYWGASPYAPLTPIPQFWMRIDGAAGTTVRGFSGPGDIEHLRYDITAAAYYLRPNGGACVIGIGGGRDLQTALLFGHERVVGVDVNQIFVDLQNNEFAEFTGLANRDDVLMVADEARSYLSRTDEQFSIVQMSLIDTWAATGAGAFSFTENALYTVEGWQVFLNRLKPDGLFTVSRWHNEENLGETGRTLSLAVASLLEAGVADPARHLAMLRTARLSTFILSKQPLTPSDISALERLRDELGFRLEIAPGMQVENADLQKIMSAKSIEELKINTQDSPLNYTPPTDDSPYFFNMLRLSNLSVALTTDDGALRGNLTATITLVALLCALMILCVVTVILPLLLRKKAIGKTATSLSRLWVAMLYFALIGTGFMFTEIGLIQKLSVFLGHPIYALGVLLFTIILATGVGSALSEWLPRRRGPLAAITVATVVAIVAAVFVLSELVVVMGSSSMGARITASIAVIAPMGLMLGVFFPVGMGLAKQLQMPETPWLWALNGVFGVLASALAVFVAIYFSITANFFIGAICYLGLLPLLNSMLKLASDGAGNDGQ